MKIVSQPDVPVINLYEKVKKHSSSVPITPTDSNFKEIIKDEIWIVENFLTKDECKALIDASEKVGYTEALVTTGVGEGMLAKDYRDSKRVMIDDQIIADYMLEKCRSFLPAAYGGAKLVGVNERMRFLKYDHPGAKFEKHCDGTFPRTDIEHSMITMQIYLNEGFGGGETTFFDKVFKGSKFPCVPKTGMCLFFRQRGWVHEGSELKSGVKYTIRTELMYRYVQPEEVQDFKHEKCGLCGFNTEFVELESCAHPFLMCRCTPFNYYNGKRFYCLCMKEIKFQSKIDKEARNYTLRNLK